MFASGLCGGILALFGVLGRKGQRWAFFVGFGLYLCDGLLLLPAALYLDAAFHLWALFRIFQGGQGLNALEKLRDQAASVGAVTTSWNQ